MIELEFSKIYSDPKTLERLDELLQEFARQEGIRVRLAPLDWTKASDQLFQALLNQRGPDLAEVGTFRLSSLVGINALAPVPAWALREIGNEAAYLGGAWRSCFLPGDPQMWSAPWTSGARLIYYRRDWLARAGVDETNAFATPEALEATLAALQNHGLPHPWAINTRRSRSTIHHVTSWVWGAGGDFVSADGRRVIFAEPEALRGLEAYYRLGRYLGLDGKLIDDQLSVDLFWQGQAGSMLDGQWVYTNEKTRAKPEMLEQVGMALPPGVPFVGGTNLVVFKHTRHPEAAWKLVQFLSSAELARQYHVPESILPTRRESFQHFESQDATFLRLCAEAIDRGRVFTSHSLGRVVEARLTDPLAQIWDHLLDNPDADILQTLKNELEPAQRRLQATVSSGGV